MVRRYIVALVCAGCVMLVVPGTAVPEPRNGHDTVVRLVLPEQIVQIPLSDEVRIILVGTALLGVASLVRRAPRAVRAAREPARPGPS